MDFGALHLPTLPGPVPPELWADAGINRVLTVLALLAALLVLRDYFRILPVLGGCLVRSRGNIEMEHSVSMARARNRCALAGLLIFCLLADRFELYPAEFLTALGYGWSFAALLDIIAAWLLLRGLFGHIFRKARLDSESRSASLRSLYNYFLAALPLLLVSAGLVALVGISDGASRVVFWTESFAVLMITLVRESQILRSKYSPLQTFLYLCGLELLPLAALVTTAAVL